MKTHGTAVWQGGIKDGKGAISTKLLNAKITLDAILID